MYIITGTVAYDYIMDFPGAYEDHILPDQIHKINLSFIVNKFERRRGGTAGNVSYSLALLKTPHLLYTCAGKDFGEYSKFFKKLKINTSGVIVDSKTYTSTGFAMTDKKDNQIWGFFYGASENIPDLQLSKIAKKGDVVLVGPSGAKGSMSMVRQCIKKGLDYIFDPGFILTEVTDKDLTVGVANAKIIIGNDYEIEVIKRRVKNFRKITKEKIIIKTLGAQGAEIINDLTIHAIKPVKVEKPVDPTGAGDAFRSGLIAGLIRGFDIKVCAQMGSVAAAYAVEHYGTQEHHYTLPQFKSRYRQTYKTLLDL